MHEYPEFGCQLISQIVFMVNEFLISILSFNIGSIVSAEIFHYWYSHKSGNHRYEMPKSSQVMPNHNQWREEISNVVEPRTIHRYHRELIWWDVVGSAEFPFHT